MMRLKNVISPSNFFHKYIKQHVYDVYIFPIIIDEINKIPDKLL